MIPLISAYSAMTIAGNVTSSSSGTSSSSPTSFNYTESYSTIYASSTTYKINITTSEAGHSFGETLWILKSGTLVAIDVSGQNLTGAEAQGLIVGAFAGFTEQVQADSEIGQYTAANYFHSTGTSTVSIGPTQVSVTTYAANTLPVTTTDCSGDVTTLTAFSLSVGTPHGANLPLVTHESLAGSTVSNGETSNFDVELGVTSITVA